MSALRSEGIETWLSGSHTVNPAEKCFLQGGAGFSGFLAQRSRTNKCQHLCQMGAGWNFCAPHPINANVGTRPPGCTPNPPMLACARRPQSQSSLRCARRSVKHKQTCWSLIQHETSSAIPEPVPAAFVKILADLSSSTCGGPIGKMLLTSYRPVLATRSVHTSVATV